MPTLPMMAVPAGIACVHAVAIAARLPPVSRAALAGKGVDANDTGCVVCQNVPETGIAMPPVMPCTGRPDVAVTPAAVIVCCAGVINAPVVSHKATFWTLLAVTESTPMSRVKDDPDAVGLLLIDNC